MYKTFSPVLLLLIILVSCSEKDDTSISIANTTSYLLNENGEHQDFLTPDYYDTNNEELRNQINKFVHFAKNSDFQHPLLEPDGNIIAYQQNRTFGDGIGGPNNNGQHHPAADLYFSSNQTPKFYASHEGLVQTFKNNSIYRHYLTITKNIKDDNDKIIGKLVTIYAHIDLDLDENEQLQLNNIYVNKGDLVSKNLYSGTMGGAHLHFEIRFYRNEDVGNEDYYHFLNDSYYTTPSSGVWSFGYWNTAIGFGYGNPKNFNVE